MSSYSSTRTSGDSSHPPRTNGHSSVSSNKYRSYDADSFDDDADDSGPPDEEQEALRRYSRELVRYMMVKYLEAKEDEKRAKEERRRSSDLGGAGRERRAGRGK